MLHFDGTAFMQVSTPASGFVNDFWGLAPNDLYAVTGAELLHWDGAAWSTIDFAGAIDPLDLTAVWGTSGADLWLGDSINGYVYRWDGTAWSTGITQTSEVRDLWGVAGGPVFAGGVFGISQWDGAAWVDIQDSDVAPEAAGLWGFGGSDVWATSDFGTLARWDGTTWADMLPAGNVDLNDSHNAIWGSAPDDVWAVGDLRRHLALGRHRLDPDHVRCASLLPVPQQGARLVRGRRLGGGPQLRRQQHGHHPALRAVTPG